MMAYWFTAGIAVSMILASGFKATAVQVRNDHGDRNVQDSPVLTRREAPPDQHNADIQFLKKLLAVLESDSNYAKQSNTNNRYQQMLQNAYTGYVQGPSRYDDKETIAMEIGMQQAAQRYYDRLRGIVASSRPGSGGDGSFGGGR